VLGLEAQLHPAQLVARPLELIDGRRRADAVRVGGGCGGGRRLARIAGQRIGDRLLEHETTVAVAVDRLAHAGNLALVALDDLQVGLELRRQLPGIFPAELLELLFVRDQPRARLVELGLEELIGAVGHHRAVVRVLVDEHRRSRSVTIIAVAAPRGVGNLERVVADRVDHDLGAHYSTTDSIGRVLRSSG
jgi:hypothetical protein